MENKITLDDIFPLLRQGRNYGNYLSGLCVFHEDSSPSMLVNEKGFSCQSCGKVGSLKTLYQKLNGTIWQPSENHTMRFSWAKGTEEIWTRSLRFLREEPNQAKYLVKRGIPWETIKELNIGIWNGWYIFPIFEGAEFMGAIARAGGTIEACAERYSNSPGASKLYVPNPTFSLSKNFIFLPFGILDAISIYSCGFAAATWTAGKHVPPEALDSIRKPIIILPDTGEEAEAYKLYNELGWRGRVSVLDYGEGKDPNDLLISNKKHLIKQLHRWEGLL